MLANSLRAQARAVVASSTAPRIGLLHCAKLIPRQTLRLLSTLRTLPSTRSYSTGLADVWKENAPSSEAAQDEEPAPIPTPPGPYRDNRTLYVGNLPAWTSEADVRDIFKDYPDVEVLLKSSTAGKSYGFVHVIFPTEEVAEEVLKMHAETPFKFDGRQLRIEWTLRLERASEQAGSHTLFVRNIPYSATEDDLRELFGREAVVTRVALGRNRPGETAGYAHVQFASEGEAQKILEEHAQTPIVMSERPLVIEYAANTTRHQRPERVDAALREQTQETSTMWIGNLAESVTERELRLMFEPMGSVMDVRLEKYRDPRSRRFAFIDFASPKIVNDIVSKHKEIPFRYAGDIVYLDYGYSRVRPQTEAPPHHTLYLYAFQRDEELLKEYFGHHAAHIRKINFWAPRGKEDSEYPSAFIEFKTVEDAEAAVNELDGREVRPGFQFRLKYAQKRATERAAWRSAQGDYGMKSLSRDSEEGDEREEVEAQSRRRRVGTTKSGGRASYGADWGGGKRGERYRKGKTG
ncbi:hypothetical protein SCP_1002640 [Sparassis crispa]|uniref:RRM domain-containing protein n=1 Tax=Sparassis crispa TaxID=139825 RepID=A0A401GXS0_9APHY|nr:hypothetical protein SCP_1002640 [Sparassis crispa]GBE87018.1 hypothetical protein SCP_1002640 [Sparassis crispa]